MNIYLVTCWLPVNVC